MLLGLSYNKWHWPLATLVFVGAWFWTHSMLEAALITAALQGINEFVQALGNVSVLYGSEKNFRVNSIQDWGYAIYGGLTGFVLIAIYEGFIK